MRRGGESVRDDEFNIENGVLTEYKGRGGDVVVPEDTVMIGVNAFNSCMKLRSITLPEGVARIAPAAFRHCENLEAAIFPDSLAEIGARSFNGCRRLRETQMPAGLRSIGTEAFSFCGSLKRLELPESVREIGPHAFEHCTALKEVRLPTGLERLGKGSFFYCEALEKVTMPKHLTAIETLTFCGCHSLRELTLPEGVKFIGWEAFDGCVRLRELRIPESIGIIGGKAFSHCHSLRHLRFPEETEEFGMGAFAHCRCDVWIRHWIPSLGEALSRHDGVRVHTDDPIEAIPENRRPEAVLGFAAEDRFDMNAERTASYFRWMTQHAGEMLPDAQRPVPAAAHTEKEPAEGVIPDAFKNPELLKVLCLYGLIPPELFDAYLDAAEACGDVQLKALVLEGLARIGPDRVERARSARRREALGEKEPGKPVS